MQRKTAVLFILALLCTMTIISGYEFLRVNNEEFMLDVYYDWHKCTCSSDQFYHDYDTYTIQRSVSIHNYSAAIDHLEVYGYPFWLDVSDWSEGLSVAIGGYSYEITLEFQDWKAHRGVEDDYTDLYYDVETGILVRVYIDTITLDFLYGFSGYSISVSLGANNIDDLITYISGRYLLYDNLLIIGIFAELAIISWLATKKKNSKESGTESADSYTTVNSLSVFK